MHSDQGGEDAGRIRVRPSHQPSDNPHGRRDLGLGTGVSGRGCALTLYLAGRHVYIKVEAAAPPARVGTDQSLHFKIEGSRLLISASAQPAVWRNDNKTFTQEVLGSARNTWERHGAPATPDPALTRRRSAPGLAPADKVAYRYVCCECGLCRHRFAASVDGNSRSLASAARGPSAADDRSLIFALKRTPAPDRSARC
jgi:hypothetical protein